MKTIRSLGFLATCLLAACTSTAPQPDRFALADTNLDGKLSRKEASDAAVRAVFTNFDTNKDGKLTFAEWKENDATADEKLFAERDTNRDGQITVAEAQASADRQKVFGSAFKEGDTDGDGLLSRDEAAAFAAKKDVPVR
jgi:Ca2+-binding EF-hand superfamily protein